MEEKDVKVKAPEGAKLSYDQLKGYAAQLTERFKAVHEENLRLKKMVDNSMRVFSLEELKCAIECVKMKECFSEKFIKSVINRIEEVLNPEAEEDANGKSECEQCN
jgi:hypothetical protein